MDFLCQVICGFRNRIDPGEPACAAAGETSFVEPKTIGAGGSRPIITKTVQCVEADAVLPTRLTRRSPNTVALSMRPSPSPSVSSLMVP